MPWHPELPYNDLPPIPADRLETKPALKACIGARAALASLQKACELLPNPGVLMNTLPVLEAQASSEIERILTTADALFRHADKGSAADSATNQGLRYRAAIKDGFRSLKARPLSTSTAEVVCSRIMGREVQVRRVPGTALFAADTGAVVYTPPEHEDRLRGMLADWERFLHDAVEVDPLIRMAAAHYQFEAIHPFTDGNGRTGRILNTLFLVEQGLLPLPILYLSRHITARRAEYYQRLRGVTEHDAWEQWLLYLLAGVEETATWTIARIDAVRSLSHEQGTLIRRELPKLYSRDLLDVIFTQPYVRIHNLVAAGIVARQAASRYLKALVDIGILEEHAAGREKLFLNRPFLAVLTEDV